MNRGGPNPKPKCKPRPIITAESTHGVRVSFGKHRGDLFTRVPLAYLKWMINTNCIQVEVARAEFARRGDTMPVVELSGHAINNASIRVWGIWKDDHKTDEGLFSWLQRVTLEAIEHGKKLDSGKIKYKGMKFVIEQGEEFPILKTIMK